MSAQELLTHYDDLNVSSVCYGTPKTTSRGGKTIPLMYNGNRLLIDTPLVLTWGINKMVDEDNGRVSYNMNLQCSSNKSNVKNFFNKLKELEEQVLDSCVHNSKDWFNKSKMTKEVAEALFTPFVRYPKDKESGEPDYSRDPTLRVKISYWEGKFNIELYDMEGNLTLNNKFVETDTDIIENYIPKSSHVVCALQCNGIWYAGGKFGVSWQLKQAMVKKPVKFEGKCFLNVNKNDLTSVEDDEKEASETPETETQDVNVQDSDSDSDSDNEDKETNENTKTPAKPKRRVIRKK